MATPKTWTAHDIKQGKLTIYRTAHQQTGEPSLCLDRRYEFTDQDNNVIDDITARRISVTIEIAGIPQEIADALQLIDSWIYQRILLKESMD